MEKVFALVLILFFSAVVIGCQKENEAKSTKAAENTAGVQGDENKAPDFTLANIKGDNVSLSDYKGKVVIIDFWATWCPPCRKGIPDLISLQDEYKDKVAVIGISLDRENTKASVPGFADKMGINYPVVYFNDQVINDFGGVSAIPTTFIIDQQGNIVKKIVGLYPKSEYEQVVKELVKKS
ncbi:MAG TPA: TlpA disulfide reductase family protein [Ignavibacteriaceae bacterium]|jgi:peroxiredoxin|nr:TlpA disulfide reductase family protein [Ignavibacteriaceae bacterium]